ncbi:uncharacterized mitochondrial protein-like protein [Tanacetum coccineum]
MLWSPLSTQNAKEKVDPKNFRSNGLGRHVRVKIVNPKPLYCCRVIIDEFKSCMMNKFEMSDLGLLQYFLGLEVLQKEDGIFVCQKKYATDLLKRFHMSNCEVEATPMNPGEKLQLNDGTRKADGKFFRSMIHA